MKAFKSFFNDVDPTINYDPEELEKGIKVELEHTRYKVIATIIAKHHLAEDPQYYVKLKKCVESKLKSEDAEDIHKPVRPGILKRQVSGKMTCSKAKSLKSKQKNKGNNTAKAAQRYLNYHC